MAKGFGLVLNLNALFCLNRLVETVVIPSPNIIRPVKFINNNNLAVLYNVVLILFHNADCLNRLIDVVGQGHVGRVGQVVNMEGLLLPFSRLGE